MAAWRLLRWIGRASSRRRSARGQRLGHPFVAEDLRLGVGLHAREVMLDVFAVEQAGELVGELQRAFADRRDVAGDDAERERRRVAEAMDPLEARAVSAGAPLEFECRAEVGRFGELGVFLAGR